MRRLRISLALLLITLLCFGISWAQQTTPQVFPFEGEINADAINIRTDSTPAANVICILNKTEKVSVVLELYDWYKIRLPQNAPSYIKKDLTECLSTPEASQQCSSAKITKERVNIRLGPDTSSAILGKAKLADTVNVLEEKDGWYKITPIPNSFGWVNKKFVSPIKAEIKTEETKQPIPENKKKRGWFKW